MLFVGVRQYKYAYEQAASTSVTLRAYPSFRREANFGNGVPEV